MTTYAARGTVRTAAGIERKVYTSKSGTRGEALTLLAEMQTVQRDGNHRRDAAIVTLDEDGNVVESVPTALHIEGAPSLKGGILAAAFAASSPKPSHFLTALADLNARPAA